MKEYIRRCINGDEGKVAFRCYSKEEINEIVDIVKDIVYPSLYDGLDYLVNDFGVGRYAHEMCLRFEKRLGVFDYGKSEASFYMRKGRKIINFCDIKTPADLGEIDVDTYGVCDLLFGGVLS